MIENEIFKRIRKKSIQKQHFSFNKFFLINVIFYEAK